MSDEHDRVAEEGAELEFVSPLHVSENDEKELSCWPPVNSSSDASAETIQHGSNRNAAKLEIEEL